MPDVVQIKSAEQIANDILVSLAALLGINDDNIGSDARTLAYAFALEVDALYYQLLQGTKASIIKQATGFQLEQIASDYDLSRRGAKSALVIMEHTGTDGTVIPVGDIVARPATQTSDTVLYSSLESVTISGGTATSTYQAQIPGASGNAGIGEIDFQFSSVAGRTSVQNITSARQGQDQESDQELRERIFNHIESMSRGTAFSIRGAALNFEQQVVRLAVPINETDGRIYVFEDLQNYSFPNEGSLLIDSESISYTGYSVSPDPSSNNAFPYFFGLTRGDNSTTATSHSAEAQVSEYINQSSQKKIEQVKIIETPGVIDVVIGFNTNETPHATLVDAVQKRLEGEPDNKFNPGYKPAGSTLNVQAVSVQSVSVEVQIQVDPEYISESADVQARVKSAIENDINSLSIGQSVCAWSIAAACDVEGVDKLLSLKVNGVSYDGTSGADLVIGSTGVGRTSGANITVSL